MEFVSITTPQCRTDPTQPTIDNRMAMAHLPSFRRGAGFNNSVAVSSSVSAAAAGAAGSQLHSSSQSSSILSTRSQSIIQKAQELRT